MNFVSKIQRVCLDGFEFFIKRDDLLDGLCGEVGQNAQNEAFLSKNQAINAENKALQTNQNAENLPFNQKNKMLYQENAQNKAFSQRYKNQTPQEISVCGGNKARKLEFLVKNAHKIPANAKIVSFGSAQSNALAAISEFARLCGREFVFVCEKIAPFLRQNPCGNFAFALQNGTQIVENSRFETRKEMALSLCESGDIFLEEGVFYDGVGVGFETLASEIKAQAAALGTDFDIFLPAGTGISALYLAKNVDFRVFCCACVGDEYYLKRQILDFDKDVCVEILGFDENSLRDFDESFSQNGKNLDVLNKNLQNLSENSQFLNKNLQNPTKNSPTSQKSVNFLANLAKNSQNLSENLHKNSNEIFKKSPQNLDKISNQNQAKIAKNSLKSPKIYILKTPKKFHFAKPYKELLNVYNRALAQCGMDFSLLYDSVGLLTMLTHQKIFAKPLLYIHQGGILGNESLLARYKHKGFC